MNDTVQPIDPRALEAAFSLFNEASAQLATAYQELQGRVEGLAGELAVANGELKRQYLEKQALSQRLGLLLAALPGGVIVLDGSGLVLEANPAARNWLGEGISGAAWSEISARRLEPADGPREWNVSAGAVHRRITVSESPLDSAGGRILLLNDITESARLKQQLEQHKKLSAMGEMAAGLAHQLRTPLATALLYAANLAKEGLKDSERLRFSERIRERLHYLERMIQEMLMFVRGEAAGDEVFVLDAVVQELAQIIEPQMAGRGVAFGLVNHAGPVRVRGGRKALSGALLNLLENALQACEAGGRVDLEVEAPDREATVRVHDNGCGIAADVQARLFEPFFTTRQEGTGLGLAIVRSVVEAHGGKVQVESVPGAGTTFVVRFPLYLEPVSA
ncbi:MAG: ATP-binding protein [Betaproteobacteria bacterium]